MIRTFHSFPVKDTASFKLQMLSWANRFNICCFLDNHHYNSPYNSNECLLAAGAINVFEAGLDFFSSLTTFYNNTNDWIFGHFNYDLKNKIEDLQSNHPDQVSFPDAFLFVPKVLLKLESKTVSIGVCNEDAERVFQEISGEKIEKRLHHSVDIKPRIQKEEYLNIIEKLRQHIHRGDCYEINFCQEFYAEQAVVDPLSIYLKLINISPNPFSAFYRVYDKYLLCASPERYFKKIGQKIISQPIKGTSARRFEDNASDEVQKEKLSISQKDKSENVMVVDLVRNDLSKICTDGSVTVEELFGIYTFPQVHQMISTITGDLKDDVNIADILQATFPMGSMTGAPKKKVMELIEQYETCKRGIYSGTLGYITPEKDADFNVVIRSIMYNQATQYLSYQVGGGITYNSNPETEYEECLLKAMAIKKVLQSQHL